MVYFGGLQVDLIEASNLLIDKISESYNSTKIEKIIIAAINEIDTILRAYEWWQWYNILLNNIYKILNMDVYINSDFFIWLEGLINIIWTSSQIDEIYGAIDKLMSLISELKELLDANSLLKQEYS